MHFGGIGIGNYSECGSQWGLCSMSNFCNISCLFWVTSVDPTSFQVISHFSPIILNTVLKEMETFYFSVSLVVSSLWKMRSVWVLGFVVWGFFCVVFVLFWFVWGFFAICLVWFVCLFILVEVSLIDTYSLCLKIDVEDIIRRYNQAYQFSPSYISFLCN